MKVWITKYWQSKGIIVSEGGELSQGKYYSKRFDSSTPTGATWFLRLGSDCFDNAADALNHVQEQAQKKIKALKKQTTEIENLLWKGFKTVKED